MAQVTQIDWKLVYEYEVFNREGSKMMNLVSILEDDNANSQDKDLITSELVIKGYIENIPFNSDLYDRSESVKVINRDLYYGVDNHVENIIDTKIKYESLMIDTGSALSLQSYGIDIDISLDTNMPMIDTNIM